MSNARKSGLKAPYDQGFLRSRAWHARRARWFAEQQRRGIALACAACLDPGTPSTLELHHLDYAGVTIRGGYFQAAEPHADLIPLHPYCHDLLHRLIDRDRVLTHHRTRRDATALALAALQRELTRKEQP